MFSAGTWPCILLLYLYGTVATSLVSQAVPVIGDIAQEFGLSHVQSGWVISLPSLITAGAALYGGWLVDRIGDKRVICAGSLFALVGNVGVACAHSLTMLFSSRLLEGVGYLSLTVGAVTLIMRTTTGARRSIALGIWTSHTAVGIGVTLSVVASLAGHGERWRWAFGGHAILMAVLAAAAGWLPAKVGRHETRRLLDIKVVLKSRLPYVIALASAASAFIQTGVMAALTLYLAKTFSISIPRAAAIGTLAEVFVVVGSAAVGFLLRAHWGVRRLALAGGAVMLAGGVALYLPGATLVAASAAVCAFSIGIGLVNGLIWTLVPYASPLNTTLGATTGLVAQATYLGVLLGPPAIFGSFQDRGWTIRIALVVAASLLQVIPICLTRIAMPRRETAVQVI